MYLGRYSSNLGRCVEFYLGNSGAIYINDRLYNADRAIGTRVEESVQFLVIKERQERIASILLLLHSQLWMHQTTQACYVNATKLKPMGASSC